MREINEGDEKDDEGEGNATGDHGEPSTLASRSKYVGRGNVQAVRAARKLAGLSDGFARSDPLLVEFSDFMKASACSENDILNTVNLDNAI